MEKIRTLFVTPWFPLPRIIKRMRIALDSGSVASIFWEKNPSVHFPNDVPKGIVTYPVYIPIQNGITSKRALRTVRFYKIAYKRISKLNPKCIHVTKVDMLLLVWFYCLLHKKPKPFVIYEISDLHDLAYNTSKLWTKRFIKKVLLWLEQICGRCVDFIILTSPLFWDCYYAKAYKNKPGIPRLFVPNSSDGKVFAAYKRKTAGIFTIGYFGNLCFFEQLSLLISMAEEMNISIIIAGGGEMEDKVNSLCQNNDRVKYVGKFNFEDDIANLYSQVDCVFAIYDSISENTKIALPNRLYDAAMCALPIIAAKGTLLGDTVEKYKIGVSVERNNKEELKMAILELESMSHALIEEKTNSFLKSCDLSESNATLGATYADA